MQALNYKEIELITGELNQLAGSHLQSFCGQEFKLYFLFWDGSDSHTWIVDLWQKCPVLLPFSGRMPKKNQLKPWSLFFKSHFLGSKLISAKLTGAGERCIELVFEDSERGQEQSIHLRLFPGGVNLILASQGKVVSYLKPKELKPAGEMPLGIKVRSLSELKEEYFRGEKKEQKKNSFENPQEKLKKAIAKKTKSIQKLKIELASKVEKIEQYQKLGEWIKAHPGQPIPQEWDKYADGDLNSVQNMQRAFDLHKKEKNKMEGTQKRLRELQQELDELQNVESPEKWAKDQGLKRDIGLKIKKNVSVRFKTITIDGGVKVLVGGSAKDNSGLIKSSKPWYYWLHLRDYPSAHAVIVSAKKSEPSLSVLRQAAEQLINVTFGAKKKNYLGIKFDIIYCEIRHLKLLKGSLGKVTYTKNKNLTVVCK